LKINVEWICNARLNFGPLSIQETAADMELFIVFLAPGNFIYERRCKEKHPPPKTAAARAIGLDPLRRFCNAELI
jgi:hypothetical protein